MKAKNRITHRHTTRREDPLPHEVGAHLFALIKRNLLSRRQPTARPSTSQLTFAL
jgi:hypothetical protein